MIVWELDLQTRRFTHVSERVVSALGYSAELWRDRPGLWIGVLHPEDRERVANAVWRAVRTPDSCEIEYRAVAVDGRIVRMRDRVHTVVTEAGHGRLLRGASLDLSDPGAPSADRARERPRRRTDPLTAEPTPEPHDARLMLHARMLDALGEAVMASDVDHRIAYWNRAAESLLGWDADEAVGRPDTELLPVRPSRELNATIVSGIVHGRPWSAEIEIRSRHGITIPVILTVSPVRTDEDIPAGVVAVITDLRRVRASTVKATRAHVMDAVARMAGGIAADLQQTRARLERAAERLLAQIPYDDPMREHAEDVHRASDSVSAIAAELQSVARSQPRTPERADLNKIVAQAMPLVRVICGERIALRSDLDRTTAPIDADTRQITQVILNIAANACSEMRASGAITLRTANANLIWPLPGSTPAPAGHYVVLEIRDSRAIPSADRLNKLFEPFLDGPQEPGLRLTVAHALVTQNGGYITVDTVQDGGLVFRIYLPRATE